MNKARNRSVSLPSPTHSGATFLVWKPTPLRVQLFSGGEEAVLVQWNLAKGTKAFLPRLGASIQVSPNPTAS